MYLPDELPTGDGYVGEVRHLLGCIQTGGELACTIDEALELARMLEAEGGQL